MWDEARKALSAVSWTEDAQLFGYDLRLYERHLDPKSLVVVEGEERSTWRRAHRPFLTPPAADLIESGFVQTSHQDTAYYAPDAEVLLSELFLDTHCFGLRRGDGEREGLIGLLFEPLRGRKVTDIKGTLWLDELTSGLRYLEYAYVNLHLPVQTQHFGGRLEFEQLPNGAWIIRRWWIRGPIIGVRPAGRWGGPDREFLHAVKEAGGEVTRITPARDQARSGDRKLKVARDAPELPWARPPLDRLTRFWRQLAGVHDPAALESGHDELEIAEGPEASIARGLVHFRRFELTDSRAEFERARLELEKTADRFPQLAWAHFALGMCLARGPEVRISDSPSYRHRVAHSQSLAESRARTELLTAIELDASLTPAALELAALGLATREAQTLRDARNALLAASRDPRAGPEVWVALADIYEATGELEAAEDAAQRALELDPDGAAGYHALAVALLRQPGRAKVGVEAYFRGAERLSDPDAVRYFEDLLGIIRDKEEAGWEAASSRERGEFLREFWELRAALAGVTLDERLAEHFRRLALAHQRYRRVGTRGAPPGGDVARAMILDRRHRRLPVDDRGLILIRHGEPDEIVRTIGKNLPLNQTWVYSDPQGGNLLYNFMKLEGRPDFVLLGGLPSCDPLHYKYGDSGPLAQLMHQSGFYGPIMPYELDPLISYYEDRAQFDGRFHQFAARCLAAVGELERLRFRATDTLDVRGFDIGDVHFDTVALGLYRLELGADHRLAAARALEHDTHRPEFATELPFAFRIYQFKGAEGKTRAVVALHFPGQRLRAEPHDAGGVAYWLGLSFVLGDSVARRVDRVDTTLVYSSPSKLTSGQHVRTQLELDAHPAGAGFYRILARDGHDPSRGQVYGGDTAVRDFSRRKLALSDLVLAEGEEGRWRRGSVELALRLSHSFRSGSPFTLFYEIYQLPKGAPYRTEVAIERAELGGLWSGIKRALGLLREPLGASLVWDGEAGDPVGPGVQETLSLGGQLLPGSYTVRVTITNLEWNETATSATDLHVQ